jgi:hypothetical protein
MGCYGALHNSVPRIIAVHRRGARPLKFLGIRWLRVGVLPPEGRRRLRPATPENVVSKRKIACASLMKRV